MERLTGLDRLEKRQISRRNEQLDGACGSGGATYELAAFELEHHVVHRGRSHPEEGLDVGLRWGSPIDRGVGVDERQVLPLLVRVVYRQGIANDVVS